MRTSRYFSSLLFTLGALLLLAANSFAADPGTPFTADGVVNDQKPGSVLIYNIYTSSPTSPATENTRISITNTSTSSPVAVHLFFIDGTSCSPADSVLCLTQNQTASFRASDFDPGTVGYIVAVAIDNNGCPIRHNFLIGDEYVKFSSGHESGLAAESISALFTTAVLPGCDETSTTAQLVFNGTNGYDRLPQTVALDNIPSRVDGNDTMVILNRISGNFAIGAETLGAIAGILYNDTENAFSFTFTQNACQKKFSITNSEPRTAPRFTTVVPTGRTGWMKFYTFTGTPLLGSAINFNPAASASPTAYNHGHNLHVLRTVNSAVATVPVFPPNC